MVNDQRWFYCCGYNEDAIGKKCLPEIKEKENVLIMFVNADIRI